MKKLLCSSLFLSLFMFSVANAQVVGMVDFDKIVENYAKAKVVTDEISDKYSEIQRYALDKEKEYKKLSTPLERKNFEEATAKELSRRQEAIIKLKQKKEAEINTNIKNAIKQVALEEKLDTVVDKNVIFYGGIDVTDKVVKQLNSLK